MRILHTSDWHLGIQLHGLPLLDDQRVMVEWLVETVRREQLDAVIIAGDIFDHAVARAEAINLYNDAMVALCRDCGVPVLICAGNHDGAARLTSCAALLRGAGLYVSGKLTTNIEPIVIGDAAIFLLPYFNADEARYLYPQAQVKNASDAMAAVTGELRARLVSGKRNILVAHCFVGGAQVSESDRAAMVGGASQIAGGVFEGFDYVALGHLHRAQKSGANARYSGSPLKYSFAEAAHPKSVAVLDTSTMEVRELPIPAAHDLRVLSGCFDTLLEAARFDIKREDYLKIELTDCRAGMEKLEQLREYYPNLLLLTGISAEMDDKAGSLTVDELSKLQPRDIARHFYEDVTGMPLDEEQLEWFEAAMSAADTEVLQ